MRIYWFWPYIHADQLVVPASVPRPGDELVVHALRGRIEPDDAAGMPITVAADLAPPGDQRERSPAWFANRATTYVQRVLARRRALKREPFDVCHVVFANYFTDGVDFRLLARRAALVWEVHDVVPHESRLPASIERRVLTYFYNAPGAIVVRHEYVRDELIDRFAVAPERITVVPWTVPQVAPPPRTAPRERRTALMFGTLRRNKGVSILLEALAGLADLDMQMVFAGRGFPDVEAEIRAAAERDPRIRFEAGYVSAERKDQLYREADLVVLPYTAFASASAVLCDAYAYNVPVVATDVGGLGMSVTTDGTGWVIPPGNVYALEGALRAAFTDRATWQRAAGAAGRAAVERSPASVGKQLRFLYEQVVESASEAGRDTGGNGRRFG